MSEQHVVDMVFVVDSTDSMTSHWNLAITHWLPRFVLEAPKILEDAKGISFKFRYACVVFNDYLEGLTPSPDLVDTGKVLCPFTENPYEFLERVKTDVFTFGGGDSPEDLLGGLCTAADELDWCGQKRLLYLMTDAPCHGTEFHNVTDSYPDGDPKGRKPYDVFEQLYRLNVTLVFMRCGRLADIMIQVFRQLNIKINIYLLECWDWVLTENIQSSLTIDTLFWTLCYIIQIPSTLKRQCISLIENHEFFHGLVIHPYYLPLDLVELLTNSQLCFEEPPPAPPKKKRKLRFKHYIAKAKKKVRL